MKTLDRSSIIALISLLEDPDEIIFNEIQKTITALDIEGIIPLQKAFDTSNSELQKARITVILGELKIKKLREDLFLINHNDFILFIAPSYSLSQTILLIFLRYAYQSYKKGHQPL
ncbi:hypothetical protein PL373_13820 [Tenacibaculum maritimum]|nr:hypothetical protein [Tenacibaculum maritimum]MDB0602203.1 hypothetical protein [Tenacibaculum maritimum]MDB0611413.1 hypothetical protein [Tenacibaculum maritimum]